MAYTLTRGDLVEKLREQIGFLDRSAALFDEGHEDEALRLAAIMRVLLQDTSTSHSLLGQLGAKEKLEYLDTSEPIHPRNVLPTMGLVGARIDVGPSGHVGRYAAPLEGNYRDKPAPLYLRGAFLGEGAELPSDLPEPPYSRPRPFGDWWNDPVTKDSQAELFARRDYVLAAAHKEGGAHVDPSLDAAWAGLTRNNTLNMRVDPAGGVSVSVGPVLGGIKVALGNPALASIRQIAYELDQTLRSQLAHLL